MSAQTQAVPFTNDQIHAQVAEDLAPLLFLAAAEIEARLMPDKLSRIKQRSDEAPEDFANRKERIVQEQVVVQAIANSSPERVFNGLKALVDRVPGLADLTSIGEVRFAKSNHFQLIQRVIQRLVRQACSTVLYNERASERRKERDARYGDYAGQLHPDQSWSPEDADEPYAGGEESESFEDQFREQPIDLQIEALEQLYHKLSLYFEVLNAGVVDNWDQYEPRSLALYSVQRADGNGEWHECYDYAEARELAAQARAAQLERAKSQTRMMAASLDAIF